MRCEAYRLFREQETGRYFEAPCQRWFCPNCARLLARQWRDVLDWNAQAGLAPSHFLTLTFREPLPLWRHAPTMQQAGQKQEAQALARRLSRALSRLVAEIRQTFGAFEYLAFVELTTGRRTPGHRPHLHLLARGKMPAKDWLSDRWRFHTKGSWRVDIQPLAEPQVGGGVRDRLHRGPEEEGAAVPAHPLARSPRALQPWLLRRARGGDSGSPSQGCKGLRPLGMGGRAGTPQL
jgi:hypothetical protein